MKTLENEARLSRGRTSVHVTQFVTSPHVTILPRHASPACGAGAVLFRALRRCQIIPAELCHVHAELRVRTCRQPVRTSVECGNTLFLLARLGSPQSGANAISTIQTDHRCTAAAPPLHRRCAARRQVTLQRQCHKNVRRTLRIPLVFLTAFPFRGALLFQTFHMVSNSHGSRARQIN